MSKKALIWTVAAFIAVASVAYGVSLSGWRQQPEEKTYKVGVAYALDYFTPTLDGFKAKMDELGYIEGKNISYDIRKLPAPVGNQGIIGELTEEGVDLIVSWPTEVSIEAKAAAEGTGIPVVFANAFIEGNNLVKSVRQPGGNITGVRYATPDMSAKRLEILHEIAPDAKRVWMPRDANYPTVSPTLGLMRDEASSLGIVLVETQASSLDEIKAQEEEFEASGEDLGIDGILLIIQPISITPDITEEIYRFAQRHGLVVGGSTLTKEDYGPVFKLVPDTYEIGELAASLTDKILRGSLAGMISVISPDGHLYVNYKAIQALGLSVSEGLLNMADGIVR